MQTASRPTAPRPPVPVPVKVKHENKAATTEGTDPLVAATSAPGKCCSSGCGKCCSWGCDTVCCSWGCDVCCLWSYEWACLLPRWFFRGIFPGGWWVETGATPPLDPPSSATKTAIGNGLFVHIDYDSWNEHLYDVIPVWVELRGPVTEALEISISFDGSVNLSVAKVVAGRGWETAAAAPTSVPVKTIVQPGTTVPFALLMPNSKFRQWELKWAARWQGDWVKPTDPCGPDLKCAALDRRVCELETTVRSMLRAEAALPADVFAFAEEQRAE